MWRGLKSTNGYEMIVVLLTITVVGIMVPILFMNVFNADRQFEKTEEDLQILKLREMGNKYMAEAADQSSDEAADIIQERLHDPEYDGNPANDFKQVFEARLKSHKLNPEYTIYARNEKQDGQQVKVGWEDIRWGETEDELVITYYVIPSLTDNITMEERQTSTYHINLPEWFLTYETRG